MEEFEEMTPDKEAWIEWAEQHTDRQRASMTTLKPFLAGARSARTRIRQELRAMLAEFSLDPRRKDLLASEIDRVCPKEE